MSIVCPGCAKAGSCAVTITAATLRGWIVMPGGNATPICSSIALRLCDVYGACVD